MRRKNIKSITGSKIPMANTHGYDMQDAANGIHHFFDVYRLPAAVIYIESILEAATLPKVWRRELPANLLCFMENLEQLFSAAYALRNSYPINEEATMEDGEPCLAGITTGGYINDARKGKAWGTLPRSLTAKQYSNPLTAINQCCSYMQEAEWKKTLQDFTECALSNTTLYEMLPDCNILRVGRYLLRLLEGCYLWTIRRIENTPA